MYHHSVLPQRNHETRAKRGTLVEDAVIMSRMLFDVGTHGRPGYILDAFPRNAHADAQGISLEVSLRLNSSKVNHDVTLVRLLA